MIGRGGEGRVLGVSRAKPHHRENNSYGEDAEAPDQLERGAMDILFPSAILLIVIKSFYF